MTDVDQRVIEQTVHIAAPPEIVWRYWVDPDRMCEWWSKTATLDPRPGGAFRAEMEERGPVMVGEYVELVPHERIAFTFGWDTNPPGSPLAPGSTRVEVTLVPDGEGTRLTLRHTEMPAAHAPEHEQGWAHFLGRLADAAHRAA